MVDTHPLRRPARAVLWDLDGTLVDSEPVHQMALSALLREAGCAEPRGLHQVTIGKSVDEVHAYLQVEVGLRLDRDAFARRLTELYVGRGAAVTMRPGALGLVEALDAAGVPQAIVSNSERRIVDTNVAAAGLGRFDLPAITRDDVENPKPDPEPYRFAAARLAVEPSACVVIEDSPTGALAGVRSGATVIAWPQGGVPLSFDPAATLADSPDAVRAILVELGLLDAGDPSPDVRRAVDR